MLPVQLRICNFNILDQKSRANASVPASFKCVRHTAERRPLTNHVTHPTWPPPIGPDSPNASPTLRSHDVYERTAQNSPAT